MPDYELFDKAVIDISPQHFIMFVEQFSFMA